MNASSKFEFACKKVKIQISNFENLKFEIEEKIFEIFDFHKKSKSLKLQVPLW